MNSTKRYRILFFIGSMGGGGAERQMLELLKRLGRERFEPLLYLHHAKGEFYHEIPVDVPVFSFWDQYAGTLKSKIDHLLGRTNQARQAHLARVLKDERIDLLFHQTHLAALDAYQACLLTPVARVAVCVGTPEDELLVYTQGNIASERQQAGKAFETAQSIVAVSENMKLQMTSSFRIPAERILVIPNLVDLKNCQKLSQSKDSLFDNSTTNLLTVGRFAEQKGHAVFLHALHELIHTHQKTDLRWHLLGQGPLESDIRQLCQKLNLTPHVIFHGFAKNPYPYYAQADLLCVPSLHEPFGNILIEALACNLPVLATNCPGGPPYILNQGEYGGLADVNDPQALCNLVLDFLEHRDDWALKAAKGAQAVRQLYSLEAGLPIWENLFLETIHNF